jgi:hypothetical protein
MSKVIRLQFSYQADLGAELITWFGHGAGYSHVDTLLDNGCLLGARSDVCEGVPAGVQIRPPDYAAFTRKFILEIPTGDNNYANFAAFEFAQLGKPYDMRAIVGFAVGRDWREPDSWFCSEEKTCALETGKVFPYLLATPANKVDPDDLLLALSAIVKVGG